MKQEVGHFLSTRKRIYKGGKRHGNWKGGRSVLKSGHVLIEAPGHPHADSRGRVLEHVFVAAKALKKDLPERAVVHHHDGDPGNNDPTNLVVCEDQRYHMLLHKRQTAYRATGNPNAERCAYCRAWMLPDNPEFYRYVSPDQQDAREAWKRKTTVLAWHKGCRREYDNSRKEWRH